MVLLEVLQYHCVLYSNTSTIYSELREAKYRECSVGSSNMTRVRNARLVQLSQRSPLEL
jgi:hypothetical protein